MVGSPFLDALVISSRDFEFNFSETEVSTNKKHLLAKGAQF